MAAITPRWGYGIQITRPALAAITGGQLVDAGANGVTPAAAGSVVAVGVALHDADPAPTSPANTVVVNAVPPIVTTCRGAVVPVTYAAAATHGQKLIAAANGQVTPAGATPDARTIVGVCEEPGGVSLGAVGLAYIF